MTVLSELQDEVKRLDAEISTDENALALKKEYFRALRTTISYMSSKNGKTPFPKQISFEMDIVTAKSPFEKWLTDFISKADRPISGPQLQAEYNEAKGQSLSQATFSSKLSQAATKGLIKLFKDSSEVVPGLPKYLWGLSAWDRGDGYLRLDYANKYKETNK